MTKIFNPLDSIAAPASESGSDMESNSKAMRNDTHGVCPKCAAQMKVTSVSSAEQCFYCPTCRVSSPMPIE